MLLNCDATFLSQGVKTSKKGNDYTMIAVMQGTETTELMLDENVKVPEELKFGSHVSIELNVNMRYKNIKVNSIKRKI